MENFFDFALNRLSRIFSCVANNIMELLLCFARAQDPLIYLSPYEIPFFVMKFF